MAIRYYQDDNGFLVYENTRTRKLVYVWDGDLADAVDICKAWHGGEASPCYRLISHDFSYRNLCLALRELQLAKHQADTSGIKLDGDDYLDLLTTIDDLTGIVQRISTIA